MAFRDCKEWQDEKLAMTTTNNEAAKLFDDVVHQYVTWKENPAYGGIEGTVKKMLESDPDFVMGKVLSVGFDLLASTRTIRLDKEFESDVANLEVCMRDNSLNARERLHCKAVVNFAHEDYEGACNVWENILSEFPNDILALKLAHDSYFYLGNSIMIRDSVGRVLPFMRPTSSFYGYVKGMYAFGLEEMNYFDLAERYAREALSLNPTDCWSTHALAHCFEMKGRTKEGVKFMRDTENDWSISGMLACHNYWHWCLYYLENGDYEDALGIYDQQIGERVKSGTPLDIVDACSLLKRLEFQGVNVGDRWSDIYDLCRPYSDDHIFTFNDAHYLMAFTGSRNQREDIVEAFMTSAKDYLSNGNGTNHDIMNKVGMKLFNAIVAYSEERYDDVVDLLYPVKYDIAKVGGSHAQRDVFYQLLLFSCIQSKSSQHLKLGQALIHERKLLKENSPLTDRMMNKLMSCHN